MKNFNTLRLDILEQILDKPVKLIKQGDLKAAVNFAKITAKKLPKSSKTKAIDLAAKNFGVDRKKIEKALISEGKFSDLSINLEDEIINIFKNSGGKLSRADVDRKIGSNKKLIKIIGSQGELMDFFDSLIGDIIIQRGNNFALDI